jgi:hypothetical protein
MKKNEERRVLLKKALYLDDDFSMIVKKLSEYEWDYEGIPVILDRETLKNILSRYLSGELSQTAVYEWADFIELRDDIDYPEENENLLSEIIHDLANPRIEGELTMDRTRFLIVQLKAQTA